MKEEFKVKDKSPRKCCLQGSELRDKATKQFTADCGLWTKTVDCRGCKSRQSKQNICLAVSRVRHGQFNRCLCATKVTAEVSRISNGKWNPCRRPNYVGAVSSYSIRHCAVRIWVSDACHVAGMRRSISAVLNFIAAQPNMIFFSICSMMNASKWYMISPAWQLSDQITDPW